MSLSEKFHHYTPPGNALSIFEQAKMEALPPLLGIDNIVKLWASEDKYPTDFYEKILKIAAEDGKLKTLTLQEYIDITMEHEGSRNPAFFDRPSVNEVVPQSENQVMADGVVMANVNAEVKCRVSMIAIAHSDTDLLPDIYQENQEPNVTPLINNKKMYAVRRADLKEWLESENEWPLPEKCLLSRWWPEEKNKPRGVPEIAPSTINPPDADKQEENILKKEGQKWVIKYKGKTIYCDHYKGFLYISHLLNTPNQEVHCQQLRAVIENINPVEIFGISGVLSSDERDQPRNPDEDQEYNVRPHTDKVSDQQAFEQYKKRRERLKELIKEAENNRDLGKKDRYSEELKQMEEAILNANQEFSNDVKKASDAIRNNINRALDTFKEDHPELFFHLKNSILTGEHINYQPEEKIIWRTK